MTATAGTQPETGWAPMPAPTPSALSRWSARAPWAPPATVGALIALGAAYTAWQDPSQPGGLFPGCPLHEMTGLDCPGCGGTRALNALTHGDIGRAFDHNAVLAVVLPMLAVAWALWMVHALRTTLARRRGRPAPTWPQGLRPRIGRPVWMGLIVALFAFAVVRNIPVFGYLASEA